MTKEQKQNNGEKITVSTNGAGTTGHPYTKKKESSHTLHILNTINSKLIIELNLETVKGSELLGARRKGEIKSFLGH